MKYEVGDIITVNNYEIRGVGQVTSVYKDAYGINVVKVLVKEHSYETIAEDLYLLERVIS